jgi:hypothetical protein
VIQRGVIRPGVIRPGVREPWVETHGYLHSVATRPFSETLLTSRTR